MSSGNGPPSFSSNGNGMNNSGYVDATDDAQGDNSQPPSYNSAMGRERNSLNQFHYETLIIMVHPSGGVEHYGGVPAPNLSGANRREASHTGDSSMVIEGSDAQDYVGMSLVGKNFRRFYPNAYYKGKDGDN
ncbi:hypothetical protein Tco_0387054 [Tanacetum coccineum]